MNPPSPPSPTPNSTGLRRRADAAAGNESDAAAGNETNDNADSSDARLLARFVKNGDGAAFSTLVERHLGLVFGTACRRTESRELAQEAAQNTFCQLARHAIRLRVRESLAPWLHKVALREAGTLLRAERSRQRTLRQLADSAPDHSAFFPASGSPATFVGGASGSAVTASSRAAEYLDEALESLPEPERRVLLLRYLQGLSLRELATAESASEEAVRKRVTRALDRLTAILARRGVTASAMMGGLTHVPLWPVPPPAEVAARAAREAATTWAAAAGLALLVPSWWPAAAVVLVAAVAVSTVLLSREDTHTAPSSATAEKLSGRPSPAPLNSGTLPEFGTDGFRAVMREKSRSWLASRHRDATSLLAMWDLTDDDALLKEAAENFPLNPQICLAMLTHLQMAKGTQEDRKLWIDRLILADPENPVGWHHMAKLQADLGDLPGVIAAMTTGLEKTGRLDTWQPERILAVREGLTAMGVPPGRVEELARIAPMKNSRTYSPFNSMNAFFKTQSAVLKQNGRTEELQQLASLGVRMAEQTRLAPAITWTTDIQTSAQKIFFLRLLDPATEIVNTGRTAAEESLFLETERDALLKEGRKTNPAMEFLKTAPLEIRKTFTDRLVTDGEISAFRYAITEMEKAGS